ncbi:MAG: hypothetical protein O3B47_00100 [bacterium]|nr:hypothetical protein [bacterium]
MEHIARRHTDLNPEQSEDEIFETDVASLNALREQLEIGANDTGKIALLIRREQDEARAKLVDAVVKLAETPEIPQQFKAQYDNLPDQIKVRCTWKELSYRLVEQGDAHYLKLATDMEEGGELVYIDEEGNPVFREGGVEPVLKGKSYNQTREILYGKDYEEGTPHYGYEMPNSNEELRQIEEITGRSFVASNNRDEYRATHMESGKKPSFSRRARFGPNSGNVSFYGAYDPNLESPKLGLVRLLRVKKMA